MSSNAKTTFSVHDLTLAIKYELNRKFRSVWVSGEISGISQPSSGHTYFTLKDRHASIRGIIWQSARHRIRFEPEEGMKVLCQGDVDVYPDRGNYQLIVRQLQPQGVGQLQIAFQQLHAKLKAEGLFDPRSKKPIPRFPKRIAVVTSPTGAAIRDFLQVVQRRWPATDAVILPVRVQGAGSAREIAEAVRSCSRFAQPPDVIVVTRGGGSIEDLWSFNEEIVCRSIFESPIPVLCGVGHEVDVTLAELTADIRALTPSEAAERLVPDRRQMAQLLSEVNRRLQSGLRAKLESAHRQLDALASRPILRRPLDPILRRAQQLDHTQALINHAIKQKLNQSTATIQQSAARLEAINPLSVLARGYSLSTTLDGKLVDDSGSIAVGESMKTRTRSLNLISRVEKIEPIR